MQFLVKAMDYKDEEAIKRRMAAREAHIAVSKALKEDGKYFVNDKEIPKEQLENQLVNALKGEANPSFTIRADGNSKHKDVVFVMGIAETHHFNLAIATTQEDN